MVHFIYGLLTLDACSLSVPFLGPSSTSTTSCGQLIESSLYTAYNYYGMSNCLWECLLSIIEFDIPCFYSTFPRLRRALLNAALIIRLFSKYTCLCCIAVWILEPVSIIRIDSRACDIYGYIFYTVY